MTQGKLTADELLETVQSHLEDNIIRLLKGDRRLYLQTQAAINVLNIVRREMQHAPQLFKNEWQRLNTLNGEALPLRGTPQRVRQALEARNARLAADIRSGAYDSPERRRALLEHLMAALEDALQIANPAFLDGLAEEARSGTTQRG